MTKKRITMKHPTYPNKDDRASLINRLRSIARKGVAGMSLIALMGVTSCDSQTNDTQTNKKDVTEIKGEVFITAGVAPPMDTFEEQNLYEVKEETSPDVKDHEQEEDWAIMGMETPPDIVEDLKVEEHEEDWAMMGVAPPLDIVEETTVEEVSPETAVDTKEPEEDWATMGVMPADWEYHGD